MIDVRSEIAEIAEEITELRHDLHMHPELSGEEHRTAAVIRGLLDSFGIKWRAVGGTGTYAEIDGAGEGESIMIRADIDALPVTEKSRYGFPSKNDGVMHACGHDVHTAALIGAVKVLSKHRDRLCGKVKIVFQQAEESGHGSQYFINEGLAEDTDRIYGFHVSPYARLGKIVVVKGTDAASCDRLTIRFTGKTSHITRPHLGADALAAAADTALRLGRIHELIDPMHRVLVGIGHINAGNTWNVVADSAVIDGSIRALSEAARADAIAAVRATAEKTAAYYGVTAEVETELNAPCLINDPEAYKVMREAAAAVAGADNIPETDVPFGYGADDFAAFSQKIKGCFAHIGTAEDEEDTQLPLHSGSIYITDKAAAAGAELLTRCVLTHLERT